MKEKKLSVDALKERLIALKRDLGRLAIEACWQRDRVGHCSSAQKAPATVMYAHARARDKFFVVARTVFKPS